jgi:hypothetical protein
MSANSSLAIRIAAIFDNKGLKQADKGVKGLQSSVKKLAGAAGIGLSTAAVINFGKQAAKAFIADQKAASQLALSVKNLGLAFEAPRIEQFISNLSKASGVTDDVLRPSMQKLLQTTGSVAKSTELLTQALDISRGSGVDFSTVVSDLTSAYVGQTRGLRKYSLGLSVAELKTMKFSDVQDKLNKQFSGANAAYLNTYAGQLGILSTAAGEAQEIIGKGLMDSLTILGGKNSIEPIAKSMMDLATAVSDTVVGFSLFLDQLKGIPGVSKLFNADLLQAVPFIGPFIYDFLQEGKKLREALGPTQGYLGSMPIGIYDTPAQIAARKKSEADALKRNKELAALQKKTTADAKSKAALDKAAGILDLQRIGITAALKGQISETDRLSLGLQLALLDKNESAASKLTGQLDAAVKRQNDLNALLLATPEAPNPYRNWVAPSMGASSMVGAAPSKGGSGVIPDFNVPANSYAQVGPMGGLGAGVIAGVNPPVNVIVTIDGKELTSIITDTQINNSLSGSFNQVNRGNFKGAVAT